MTWLPGDEDPVMNPREIEEEEADEQEDLELTAADEDELLEEMGL